MAGQLAQLDPAELSKSPSVSPPPGAIIDFDGPNPLETTIISVTTGFMGLAFLFVGIRVYTKTKIKGSWSWDDVTCAFGLISTLVYWIIILLQTVNEGFGRHFWNVPLIITLSDASLKLVFISDWLINVAYTFVKLTYFILYWNIFKPFRWLKLGIIGGAVVIIGIYIACTIAKLIEGAPSPGHTWRETSFASHNSIGQRLSVPLAAWGVVSDVFILLLPISGVLRLQLSPKKRFALLMVFMTGIGACICSSLSLYYRTTLNDQDITYTVVNIQIMGIVELCVGIIITCMPATSVFLRHILPPASTLQSKLSSYFKKYPSSLPQSRTAGIDGPYRNLKEGEPAVSGKEEYDLGLYPTQIETGVTVEPLGDFEDDGIRLRVDLEQF